MNNNNQQHTPGPWLVKEVKTLLDEPYYTITAPHRQNEYGAGGSILPNGLTNIKKDASLISAAPDMLAALESLLGYFENTNDWIDCDPVDVIESVIKRAKGEH